MVKGFFKGFKHFPNFFEGEEDEEEIQIGMPTDVKHVAHIGADGPVTESPSWMKDYEDGETKSGPIEMTKSYEDKKGKNHRVSKSEEITIDIDVPKKHRRRATDNAVDPSSTTKSKHRRRHRIRRSKETGDNESSTTKLPDIPKKSRRKKPTEDEDSLKSSKPPKGSESSDQ